MKKNTKQNIVLISAIYAIIFAVLNVLIFVILKPKHIEEAVALRAYWISYVFMVIAFALQITSVFVAFFKNKGLDAVFMGVPLTVISMIYFVSQLVVSILFMVLGFFNVKVPTTLVVILQILILAVYLVISIIALLGKNLISQQGEQIKANVKNIRDLVSDVDLAVEACNDETLKNELRKFSEDIKYSDPVTIPEVEGVENQLRQVIADIKTKVYGDDYTDLQSLIKKGKLFLAERNNKISNSK